jgi:hypothetical protein
LAKRNSQSTGFARAGAQRRLVVMPARMREALGAAVEPRRQADNPYSDWMRLLSVLLRLLILVFRLLRLLAVLVLPPLPSDWIELIG